MRRSASIALLAGVLAACGSNLPASPDRVVHTTIPATKSCSVAQRASDGSAGTVWVDDKPTGAVLFWQGAVGGGEFRCTRTVAGAADAERIVVAVRSSLRQPIRSGPAACPADSREALAAYLTYDSGVEVVQVLFSGCGGVTAPGRAPRYESAQLDAALVPLAPVGFQPLR